MIVKVPLEKIHANPYQPESRLNVPEEVAERFGKSILEHGLMQTPVARFVMKDGDITDEYEMGDGWLRLSGFKWLVLNGHPEFNEMPLDVRELTDQQMADMILEANTVRKDMTPIDEAKLYKMYLEDFGVTQAELAKSHNLTQGALANKLRLLELPADIQEKVISQEITETHGRALLQLEDHKQIEKMAQKVIVQNLSVANLDREIKATLWSNTVPLYYEEGNTEKIPIFDREECPKCEHYRLLKDPWKDDEKKPRCAYKKCWKEKQNAALDAQNKKALEKLAARGIKHIVEYDYRTMAFLHSEWDECKTCDKRAACKEVWGKGFETVCLDRPCHDRLAAAERKAAEEKRLAEKLREEQEINSLFNEKVVRPGKHIPLTIIDCILRSRQYSYGQEEMLEKLTRVFDPEPPKGQKATIKSFLASCRKLDEEELFYHVLPRLAFEVFKLGVNDRVQIEQILQSFQTKPAPKKSKKKEEDDPLAGLVIRTAAKEGEKHEIKLGNITIRYSEIKECAQILGVNMNWGYTTEEIINTLKSMPESSNRDLLIAILADQSKEKEQVMPCADCVFSKNCSKKLGRNFLAPDGEGGYKCVQKIQSAAKKPADYTPTLEPPCDYCFNSPGNGGTCDKSLYHCQDGPGSVLVCEEMAPVKPG